MIRTIQFENFKSLKATQRVEIQFGKLTILAGLNSAGKSSVIQGLLLSRTLAENVKNSNNTDNNILHNFPINGNYLLSLGSAFEAISKESGKEFSINVLEENLIENRFFTEESKSDSVYEVSVDFSNHLKESFIANSDFYYLNAERLGPRIRHGVNEKGGHLHCGYSGEYTIEVITRTRGDRATDYPIDENKYFQGTKLDGIQDIAKYAASWMEYITPGADLGNSEIIGKIRSATIELNGNTPPNVGFGISYVLPIVVTGLLAKPGSIFIVENPEAHLHPKGQSNIGYFLGQMASAGIQIVIETHSEHVVNGIRRAALSLANLRPNDVKISFFSGVNANKEAIINQINIRENGDLTSFPKDFFDQTRQDLLEILKLSNR